MNSAESCAPGRAIASPKASTQSEPRTDGRHGIGVGACSAGKEWYMRLRRLMIGVLAFWMVAVAIPRSAEAGLLLRVEDLGSGFVATVNDLFGSGAVNISTSLGPNITFISAMGISKPMLPAAAGIYSQMFLNSFTLTTARDTMVRISLLDSGFTGGIGAGPLTLWNTISGNLMAPVGSTLTARTHAFQGATLPTSGGISQQFTSFGVGTTFANSTFTEFEATGSYSMYTQVTMAFTGAGNISFNQDSYLPIPEGGAAIVPVPEPGTLVMLATGVFGLVCTSRRRRFSLGAAA